MKKNIVNKLALVLVLFSLVACRAKRPPAPILPPVQAPIQNQAASSKAEILKKIIDRQVIFNTLLIKAKADLNINNSKHDVSMNIRMQKDKVIWVSVSAAIIGEVARALITPDSIKIINRFDNTYTKKPFSYVYQFASKQVNFKTLQDIFIGNAFTGTLTETSTLEANGGQTHIKGDLSGLAYHLIFNASNNLLQSNLADKGIAQSLTVNYGDHSSFSNQIIPQTVNIKSAVSSKNLGIDLRYTQVNINEAVDFPFSVPKRFTVKN